MNSPIAPVILLFDGVCNYCNYWVNFAIKRDPKKKLKFAPLQGESAKKLLEKFRVSLTPLSSVILIENEKIYTQSSAALRMTKHLSGGWKLFYAFIVIPKFIRDALYNIIARNRYKWYGKRDACRVPEPGLIERFLD